MSASEELLLEKQGYLWDFKKLLRRSEQLVCDCTHTQACKICAESKGIDWDDEWDAN